MHARYTRHHRIDPLDIAHHHVSFLLPVSIKCEAYAFDGMLLYQALCRLSAAPVSSASSTIILSTQENDVSSLALVPLVHPWPCVVEG